MRMIALVATRPFTYGGRLLGAGERFDATPIDAVVLTYHRQAAFAPRGNIVPAPAPSAAPDSANADSKELDCVDDGTSENPRRKRTYKRRDLQAEE